MAEEKPKKGSDSMKDDGESTSDVIGSYLHPGRQNVMLIYVLYLVGLVPAFGSVPIIVGFIMVLLNRGSGGEVWSSHYEYLFRTAAIGLLFIVVSGVLTVVLIGIIGIILTFVWWIIRAVKGLQAANKGEAIADPKSYSW